MTALHNQKVKDASDTRKYFAMVPHMADDDLNCYEYRLYGHYLRVCGEGGGKCEETEKTTYTKCGMRRAKFITARQSLIEKGFIVMDVEPKPNTKGQKGNTALIVIKDRWLENVTRYSRDVPIGNPSKDERFNSEPLKGSQIEHVNAEDTLFGNPKKKEEPIEEKDLAIAAAPTEESNVQKMPVAHSERPVSRVNPMFELAMAFVEAFKLQWSDMPKSEQGKWLKVAKALHSLDTPVTPADVPSLYQYAAAEARRGSWKLTITSIPARVAEWRKLNKIQQPPQVEGSNIRFTTVDQPEGWYTPRQEFDVFHPVKKIRIGTATNVEEMEQVIADYDANSGAA